MRERERGNGCVFASRRMVVLYTTVCAAGPLAI